MIQTNKGNVIAVAQDAYLYRYDEKQNYIYYETNTKFLSLAIFLEHYRDNYCKVIINDKVLCVDYKDLREVKDEQINKISLNRRTNS